MSFPGTLRCSTGTVSGKHLPRLPTGQHHQVAFIAAGCKPGMSKRVPEQVAMYLLIQPGALCSTLYNLRHAGMGYAPLTPNPQVFAISVLMRCPNTQVAVKSSSSLTSEWAASRPSPLAHDICDVVIPINIHLL